MFFIKRLDIHKSYEHKVGLGVCYAFNIGIFEIGWVINIIMLLFKTNTYYINNKIKRCSIVATSSLFYIY